MSQQNRLTVAKWLAALSLGTRLSFLVALIVFTVVTSVAYLDVRSYEAHVDRDLADAARLAAQSSADTLVQRTEPYDPLDIRDSLHDLVAADPVLDAISVIEADETGRLRIFTSTSTEERAEILELAGRAITTKTPTSARGNTVTSRMVGTANPSATSSPCARAWSRLSRPTVTATA